MILRGVVCYNAHFSRFNNSNINHNMIYYTCAIICITCNKGNQIFNYIINQ